MTTLANPLDEVRRRIRRQGSRPINEENTKATLIEPILRALGWDVEDVEEVQREFKTHARHKPVDYGLLLMRTPRLLIEAKALRANLLDHKWVGQIMGYASVAGVEWVVLTNGDGYRIYNAHAPVVVEEKLFRSIQISDGGPEVEQTLELLAKDRLEENRIEVLWRTQFVDHQVRSAIESIFSTDVGEKLLLKHVSANTKNLSPAEIRSSIARCRVSLDFPAEAPSTLDTKQRRHIAAVRAAKTRTGTALPDLIASGTLRPPVQLTRTYKGHELQATLLASGTIQVGTQEFSAPSPAASAAIQSATGKKRAAVDGWEFWRMAGPDGRQVSLGSARPAQPGRKSGKRQ